MKKYIGLKVVKAEPMTMTEAQKVLGRELKPATVEEEMICLRGKDSFKEGAKWAINEFLKDLWHDASEEPRKNNIYLAQIGDCAFDTFYDSKNWDTYSKGVNITRWLYIDDLLPKKGGAG